MPACTLPAGLRDVADRHQATSSDLRWRAAAAALQHLAQDPRLRGVAIGRVGVVPTGTRDLRVHPHVHYRVPGGGLAPDGRSWVTAHAEFFVHVTPLAALLRATVRAALRPHRKLRRGSTRRLAPGRGGRLSVGGQWPGGLDVPRARIALRNHRIVALQDGPVTFRYREGDSGQLRTCPLPAEACIQRFLQHILPKGFVKVRYDGLFRVGQRQQLARIRAQLILQPRTMALLPPPAASSAPATLRVPTGPSCGQPLHVERMLPAQRAPPVSARRA